MGEVGPSATISGMFNFHNSLYSYKNIKILGSGGPPVVT